jgi:hypothetical protein
MSSDNKKSLKKENKDKLLHISLRFYSTFYPKYYLLETLLKNRLFLLLKEKLGENWFSLQINSNLENNLFKQEADFILRRKSKGFVLRDKGLLVESGFGLWVEFFNRHLYKEIKGLPILIFPKLPPTVKRKELYQKLNKVKDLRNQLFHYRLLPITEVEQVKYLDKLVDANKDLMNLLTWLDAPLSELSSNEFENNVDEIRKMLI